jgi:hypothetical protein
MTRIYDSWMGGKDNYAADRAVGEQVAAAYPDVRVAVRAQRAFLARAAHFLVTKAGIRQFPDIGDRAALGEQPPPGRLAAHPRGGGAVMP